jgi:hypothetical protein
MGWMEWVAIYVAGVILFNVWEAYVGFGFKFPKFDDGPNAICASVFWPIGLPICLLILFCLKLSGVKERRLEKENTKARIRIAAQEEEEVLLKQIEKELQDVKAEDQNTTEHAQLLSGSSSSYARRGE